MPKPRASTTSPEFVASGRLEFDQSKVLSAPMTIDEATADISAIVADLATRTQRLEDDRRTSMALIRMLAGECGYELETRKQGGGKVRVEWVRRSGLVMP